MCARAIARHSAGTPGESDDARLAQATVEADGNTDRIREPATALGKLALALVPIPDRQTARLQGRLDLGERLGDEDQRLVECDRDSLARRVIRCGTEPPAQDHELGLARQTPDFAPDLLRRVACHRKRDDLDTRAGQLGGKPGAVRVRAATLCQFVTDEQERGTECVHTALRIWTMSPSATT